MPRVKRPDEVQVYEHMRPVPNERYVIVELGWEYNDEWYYHPESGGGTPTQIYLDKQAAADACKLLNDRRAKSMHDDEYNNHCPRQECYGDDARCPHKIAFYEVVPVKEVV